MSNNTNSTRQVILVMLKKSHELTVSEMAQQLEITEMAVRRHLQGLEKEGLIHSKLERQPMGRPTHKYFLTLQGDESFPRNYGNLSLEFLHDLERISGTEVIEKLFEQRRERLQQKYGSSVNGDFDERVETLARIQNENGYMVEVEKDDDGTYRFIEYNCPIAKVASAYPVACNCEQKLFKTLLNTDDIEREECMAKENTPSCVYRLKETK
ncbi:metalloregulator ArsR/SmtB family transcription factor [Alkalihalophilus lindianensis]|uniref:Metalloregulator ArsR/SmtB family transcription factor n=1 Tax=Alkalihalophilus lindianensis TaxID=1630542 RepID=A0ABU3X8D1_9BACI|nr:metalloregulator ArsR/SmtB family transcription factor [Alkalihalophilus lindianensis]MDV2684140.1 metalloregulator ArsR/SmtB family transcription factor [Alkalihalophilus lindianensis]